MCSLWRTPLLLLLACAGCTDRDEEREWGLDELRGAWRATTSESGAFEVVAPRGVPRSRLALAATESLEIGGAVRVVRAGQERSASNIAVVSMGDLSVGSGARVGSVYSLGSAPLRLSPGAAVNGYVRASAPLSSPAGSVRLGVLARDPPGTAQSFRWRVPAEGGADVVVASAAREPIVLSPGSHRNVTVENGGTLLLGAGQHSFASLELGEHGVLELDNTRAPVFVWVHRQLDLAGHVVHHSPVRNVLWGFAGEQALRLTRDFRGIFVAPRAKLQLARTSSPHAGSFFARAIVVEDGAVIEQEAFSDLTSDPSLLQNDCYQCTLEAASSARDCCRAAAPSAAGTSECPARVADVFEACARRRELGPGRCHRGHVQRTLNACGR